MKEYFIELYRRFFGVKTSEKSKEINDVIHSSPFGLTDRIEFLNPNHNDCGTFDIRTDESLVDRIYESVCFKNVEEPEKEEKPANVKCREYPLEGDISVVRKTKENNPRRYFDDAEKRAREINPGLLIKDIAKRIGISYVKYSQLRSGEMTLSEELSDKIFLTFYEFGVRIDERAVRSWENNSKHNPEFSTIDHSLDYEDRIMNPEDSVEKDLMQEDKILAINRALISLTSRQIDVMERYYRDEQTLDEIGHDLNLTRERVRQIKEIAIRKLNHPKRSKELKQYL